MTMLMRAPQLFFIVCIAIVGEARAALHSDAPPPQTQWFVASERNPAGNDANNGSSPVFPLASLHEAFLRVRAQRASNTSESFSLPMQILLLGGVHRLHTTLQIDDPFMCGSPFGATTVEPFPSTATVIISGGAEVELGRISAGSNVFEATIPREIAPQWMIWQIFHSAYSAANQGAVNVAQERAKLFSTPTMHYSFRNTSDASPHGLNITLLEDPIETEGGSGFSSLRSAFVYVYHSWTSTASEIQSFNPRTKEMVLKGSIEGFYAGSGNRYRIVNMLNTSTFERAENTFTFDPATRVLRYRPANSVVTNATTHLNVTIPQVYTLVNISNGCTNLQFEGLHFQHSDSYLEYCLAHSCGGTQGSGLIKAGAVTIADSNIVSFVQSSFRNVGLYAVHIASGTQNVKILRTNFSSLGTGGIQLGNDYRPIQPPRIPRSSRVQDIEIADCEITDSGHVTEMGDGIFVQQAENVLIHRNYIHHLFYSGIGAGWSWFYGPSINANITIRKNRIAYIGRGLLSDMGCFHNLGVSANMLVDNNICHDVQSYGYGGNGLYTDQGSADITYTNNIVYRAKSGSYMQHWGENIVVRNNIFALPTQVSVNPEWTRTGFFSALYSGPPKGTNNNMNFQHNIVLLNNVSTSLFVSGRSPNAYLNGSVFDYNCYFNLAAKKGHNGTTNYVYEFPTWSHNTSLGKWQEMGYDQHSLITNPEFSASALAAYNFSDISMDSPCVAALGFKPIDTSDVGPRK